MASTVQRRAGRGTRGNLEKYVNLDILQAPLLKNPEVFGILYRNTIVTGATVPLTNTFGVILIMTRLRLALRRGFVVKGVLVSLSLIAVWRYLVSTTAMRNVSAVTARSNESDTKRPELEALLHRTGVTAETLATCDASESDVDEILTAAESWWTTNGTTFASRTDALHAAHADVVRTTRLLRRGDPSATVEDLRTAREALSEAETAHGMLVDDFRTTCESELNVDQRALLSAIRNNRDWDLDEPHSILELSQSEWVHLRRALRSPESSWDQATESFVALVHADADYLQAHSDCQSNEAALKTAWADFWSQEP